MMENNFSEASWHRPCGNGLKTVLTLHVDGDLLHLNLAGAISIEEYKTFEAQLQKLSGEKVSFRLYADATGIDGVSVGALWEEIKNLPAYRNVSRFAVIEDKTWMQLTAKLSSIFTKGEIKFFEPGQEEEAKSWVRE